MRIEADVIKTAAVLLLILAATILLTWAPDREQRSDFRHRISKAELEVQQGRAVEAKLTPLRRTVEQLETRYRKIARRTPAEPELAGLMRPIHTALQQQGVEEMQTRHQAEVPGADYHTLPFDLAFQSGFFDAFLFLEKVESLPRLLRVEDLHLIGQPENPAGKLDVSIKLSAFYSPSLDMEMSTLSAAGDQRSHR